MKAGEYDLAARTAVEKFLFPGTVRGVAPYGTGHIHATYAVETDQAGTTVRYLLQRVNDRIFSDVPAMMRNIQRVTDHLRRSYAAEGCADLSRRVLTPVPTRADLTGALYRDPAGGWWRMYLFVEGARGHDVLTAPEQAQAAARAFGDFLRRLSDFSAATLHETLPGFHDPRKRGAALDEARAADRAGRVAGARAELDFVNRHRARLDAWGAWLAGPAAPPRRVTHNDTKLNNVLLDERTNEGVCVIDLDTVMPGAALFDFGDLVRTGVSPAAEDERDLARVALRPEYFAALARGFLAGAGASLSDAERERLPAAGALITLVIGIRFLTDHLNGDVYFRVRRPNHNLDRCRTQFRLAELLFTSEAELRREVARINAEVFS